MGADSCGGSTTAKWRAAEKGLGDSSPIDLVENAFLASVECWSAFGDFQKVKETYGRLAELDLADRKKKRYLAIASRFSGVPTESREAPEFPDYLRQPHAYADIWFVDLVEWEMDGDPEQVAAMIGPSRFPGLRDHVAIPAARNDHAAATPAAAFRLVVPVPRLSTWTSYATKPSAIPARTTSNRT